MDFISLLLVVGMMGAGAEHLTSQTVKVVRHHEAALKAIQESHFGNFNEHFKVLFGHDLRAKPKALRAYQMDLIKELRDAAKTVSQNTAYLNTMAPGRAESVIMIHEYLCKWAALTV